MGEIIKVYKGTDKDMKCRGMQYELGKTEKSDGAVRCGNKGFHSCEAPLDVLKYYDAKSGNRFFEAEAGGEIDRTGADDSKVASSELTLKAEIGLPGLVKAQIEYVKKRCTNEHNAKPGEPATAGYRGAATAGYRGAATAGDSGAATAGDSGAATAGDSGAATAGSWGAATAGSWGAATAGSWGAATAGDSGAATAGSWGAATAGSWGAATAGSWGAATAGYRGAATAGSWGAATAGSWGAATAGYRGAATAGYRGAATAGDSGAATSRGSVTVGENGVGTVRGENVKIRGGMGALLVCAIESDDGFYIIEWKAVVVDGERIKAGVFYTLKNGEFVETE